MANLTALAVARQTKKRSKSDRRVIYCSDQTHSSLERGLKVIGFQNHQIRKLRTDDSFRLNISDLRHALSDDRKAGRIPFCVVGNAGTTNTGAVDPLPEIADICRAEELWFHVDGAYGAASIMCDEGRQLLKGIEHADSISIDPHKWLFQPFEIGCVLLRDRERLRNTFRILPEYMKDVERGHEEINFCDYGIQLTRGFRALKLWMSLQVFGVESFRKAIERGMTLAKTAEQLLGQSTSKWEVITPASMGIVTFRYNPKAQRLPPSKIDRLNQRLITKMTTHGYAMVSSTVLKGRTVLRMCTINPRTNETEVKQTIRMLERWGNQLSSNATTTSTKS